MQEDLLLQKTLHVRNISMADILEDIKISLDKIVNAIMKLRYKNAFKTFMLKTFFKYAKEFFQVR
jgi:DNA-directed RNA polymerase specialized sigma54-like protein